MRLQIGPFLTLAASSGRLRVGRVEADLRDFALGRCGDLEKLAWLEIEHSGDDVGGELLDLGVEVAYYSIVVAARILDRVFELRQRVLELRERFDGAQLWIGF